MVSLKVSDIFVGNYCLENFEKNYDSLPHSWDLEFFWMVSPKVSDIFGGNYCLENFEKIMTPQPPTPIMWDEII